MMDLHRLWLLTPREIQRSHHHCQSHDEPGWEGASQSRVTWKEGKCSGGEARMSDEEWVIGCGWSDIIASRRGRKSTDEVDTYDLVEA